jgi:hypothetical protein
MSVFLQALYGKHVAKETYPEDTLLPDYAGLERKKEEVNHGCCFICMICTSLSVDILVHVAFA